MKATERLYSQKELLLRIVKNGEDMYGYLIHERQGVFSGALAEKYNVPATIDNLPDWMVENGNVAPETLEAWQEFFAAIERGDKSGSVRVSLRSETGAFNRYMLRFNGIRDEEDVPFFAMISVEDVNRFYERLRNQDTETNRLKKNERILQLISRHSERIVLYYDIKTQTIRTWDDEAGAELPYEQPISDWLDGNSILPDSREAVQHMLRDIQNGVSYGEKRLHIKNKKGERRWLDQKYSTLYDEEDKPAAALISFKDVTDIYEYELAYQRYIQSVEVDNKNLLFIESDLTADRVEKADGQLLSGRKFETECSHSDFSQKILSQILQYENPEAAFQYFSRENLLWLHAQGERKVQSHWHVQFPDNSMHWLDTEITLMTDPYTDHVRAFQRMADITEEKERQLVIQYRSERDGMTGLLNRVTAEKRIRDAIETKKNPGILVLLDLDDLKGINDTYGHDAGDRAIRGIAETLKTHFRESDIIGRIGGDEFVAYLPGSSESSESIAVSITTLLRKLAGISVGENNECRIHCSVGCAVQTAEADTFEILYKRADQALYKIKRGGKNNFAFYSRDLDQKLRKKKLLSLQNARKFEVEELQYLLSAMSSFYLLMLSSNLTTNDYFLLEVKEDTFAPIPAFGELDKVIEKGEERIHPDDRYIIKEKLSRQALLDAYARGRKDAHQYIRLREGGEYRWVEITVIFYTNERGNICNFVLLRWAKERDGEPK